MNLLEALVSRRNGPIALYAVRELEKTGDYFPDKGRKPKAVLPGSVGSEGIVAQILSKFAGSRPNVRDHPPIKTLRAQRVRDIVLVDDVGISGTRIDKFLLGLMRESSLRSWASLGLITVHFVAYSITESARRKAELRLFRWSRMARENRVEIHTHVSSLNGSCSLDERLLREAERLCSKYPKTLPPQHAHARYGYKHAMATTVFEHGCPNNVPAMFWVESKGWTPLFPARGIPGALCTAFGATSVDRRERLAMLVTSPNPLAFVHDADDVVCVLRALRRRSLTRSELVHVTNIGSLGLDLILDQCRTRALIGPDGRTSEAGREAIRRLSRTIPAEKPLPQERQLVYIPSALRESRVRV